MQEGLFKAKMSVKGQLVIPKNFRHAYGFREGDDVILVPRREGLLIRPVGPERAVLRGLLKGLDVDVEECEKILEEARRSLVRMRV